MSNFIVEKQPNEIEPYSVDFARRIPTGETVDSGNCTVNIVDGDGNDKNTEMLVASGVSGTIVSGIVTGGVDGEDYIATFVLTTTPTGYKFEDEITIQVRERHA